MNGLIYQDWFLYNESKLLRALTTRMFSLYKGHPPLSSLVFSSKKYAENKFAFTR